jgi:hypothetical protein
MPEEGTRPGALIGLLATKDLFAGPKGVEPQPSKPPISPTAAPGHPLA